MQCPNCNTEYAEYVVKCKCGYNFQTGQVEKGGGEVQGESYVGKAFLSLALYHLACWIPGLITNIIFLSNSSKTKSQSVTAPKGHGCLIALLIVELLAIPLFFFLGIIASISIPAFIQAKDKAIENACHNNMRVIAQSVQLYIIDQGIHEETDIPLYNNVIMPSSTRTNDNCYIRNYLTCPRSKTTYGDFVNSYDMNVTCPVSTPGKSHGTYGDLE